MVVIVIDVVIIAVLSPFPGHWQTLAWLSRRNTAKCSSSHGFLMYVCLRASATAAWHWPIFIHLHLRRLRGHHDTSRSPAPSAWPCASLPVPSAFECPLRESESKRVFPFSFIRSFICSGCSGRAGGCMARLQHHNDRCRHHHACCDDLLLCMTRRSRPHGLPARAGSTAFPQGSASLALVIVGLALSS